MKKTSFVGVSLLLTLMLAVSAFGQARQPAAKTPAEHTAYLTFYNETNPAKKAELGEKFIVDFKDSEFVPGSYGMILRGYAGAQNWAKVMDVADRWAGLPGANPTTKVNAFTAALEAAQQANNFQKIVEYGDKILAIDGSNLNAQLVLATLLPERLPNDEAGKQAALTKAEGLATKAISGLGSMAKPAGVSDPDWNGFKSSSLGQLHGALGLIYLTRADYEKAEKAYEEALKSTPKDGVARYRLGLAIEYQMPEKSKAMVAAIDAENAARRANADKAIIDEHAAVGAGLADLVRQMRDKAIDQFAYAVAIGGAQAGPARVELEKLYKNKNEGSLQGLDELISKKKAEIG